jgi:AraC-like DNA-binding protein
VRFLYKDSDQAISHNLPASVHHKDAFTRIRPTKLRFYLRYMEKLGFSANQVFAGTSLDKKSIENRHLLIETYSYIKVVSNMMELTQLPDLAFKLGKELRPGDLGILGHTFAACSNTSEGTAIWQKYNWLFFGNFFSATESFSGGLRWFEYTPRVRLQPHLLQFFIEEKINVEITLFRKFNNCVIPSHSYSVTYPAPAHAKLYEELLGVPVTFDAHRIAFALDNTDNYADRPFPGADNETLELCTHYLDDITTRVYTHSTLSAKTRFAIKEYLPKILTIDDMAQKFRYSARTFCRNLKIENTSYQQLLAEVREDTTKNYLATTSLKTEEIASLIGFTDTGSLRRAFKSWAGTTISEFKQKPKADINYKR